MAAPWRAATMSSSGIGLQPAGPLLRWGGVTLALSLRPARMPDTRRLDELLARWSRLRATGEAPSVEELCRDCPELLPELRQRIDDLTAQDVGNRITAFGAPASDYTVDAPSPRGVR